LQKSGNVNGIKVSSLSRQERNRLKSSIQTIAKSRGQFVNVLNDRTNDDFYAWFGNGAGRFAGPDVPLADTPDSNLGGDLKSERLVFAFPRS
jgi:hypothetical protein